MSETEFLRGVGSAVDVFEAGAFKALLNFPELLGGDFVEGILRKQKLEVEGQRRFTRDEVAAIHPFRDGCLVHLKCGKVWQYFREEDTTKVVKSPLPLRRVSLLSVSDCGGRAAACTESGGVYVVALPSRRAEGEGIVLKESDASEVRSVFILEGFMIKMKNVTKNLKNT